MITYIDKSMGQQACHLGAQLYQKDTNEQQAKHDTSSYGLTTKIYYKASMTRYTLKTQKLT